MGTPRSPGMVLHSLVQGQGEGPSLADVPVPACLNQCINQEAFACKVRLTVFSVTASSRYLLTVIWWPQR